MPPSLASLSSLETLVTVFGHSPRARAFLKCLYQKCPTSVSSFPKGNPETDVCVCFLYDCSYPGPERILRSTTLAKASGRLRARHSGTSLKGSTLPRPYPHRTSPIRLVVTLGPLSSHTSVNTILTPQRGYQNRGDSCLTHSRHWVTP